MPRICLTLLALAALTNCAWADDTAAAKKIAAATAKAAGETFDLKYKFTPGEVMRTKVVHVATTETKIQGVTEKASSRSVSIRAWNIKSVDEAGNITFTNTIEAVDMWQKVGTRQEIRYDSRSSEKAPAEYEHVAGTIGKPMATITIDPYGREVDPKRKQLQMSIADLAVPLPGQAVKIGQQWHMPEEIKCRLADGTVKVIKARQKYTLQQVTTGVATIGVETEILTPVNDPKIQSQLVQKMQHGTIKFDVDAGRLISKQIDLNETVIGFNGNESLMQYLARMTEEQVSEADAKTAKVPSAEQR